MNTPTMNTAAMDTAAMSRASMITTRRRSTVALLGGLVVLALAWTFGPALNAPPLYDGIGFPDAPYRYVKRPPHAVEMPPPTPATGVAKQLPGGGFDAIVAGSDEQGPQVLVTIGAQQLTAPAGCTAVTMTATPLAPTTPVVGGTAWGNVYRFGLTCTAGATGAASAARSGTDKIQLRAPDGTQPGPIVEYADPAGGGWRKLTTVRIGNDNYQGPLVGNGDYVLVRLPDSGLPFGLSSTAAVLLAAVIALGALIGGIRLRRARAGARTATEARTTE